MFALIGAAFSSKAPHPHPQARASHILFLEAAEALSEAVVFLKEHFEIERSELKIEGMINFGHPSIDPVETQVDNLLDHLMGRKPPP